MDDKTIDYLINLNKSFYKNLSSSSVKKNFSDTRKASWIGWNRLATIINECKDFKIKSILDVGCGNGRFYKEVIENQKWIEVLDPDFKYVGVDTDLYMLDKARNQYPSAEFMFKDIINKRSQSLDNKFDLVVSFGVAHHVPGGDLRMRWFKSLSELVNSGGFLAVTLWDFIKAMQFKRRNVDVEIKLEDNDYFLGWDNEPDLYRYCHYYDAKEVDNIIKDMKLVGLELVNSYSEDGKDHVLNRYLLFKRAVC